MVNGRDVLHAARCNYLGLSGAPQLSKVGEETMRKYGVGSCGPRGFYGTIGMLFAYPSGLFLFLWYWADFSHLVRLL